MSLARLSSSLDTVREDVRQAIGAAAQRTGVDFSSLLAMAKSESGLDPTAKASSSTASGLYQFLDQSWLAIVKKHGAEQGLGWAADAITAKAGGGYHVDAAAKQAVMGLREQAGPAALMAASYAADNAQGLSAALGRDANATDLYFAHFLGLAGAKRFLSAAQSAPDASAARLFPTEARANRAIFYAGDGSARSLGQVYALMGDKLARAGAGSAPTDGVSGRAADSVAAAPARLRYALFDGDSDAAAALDGDGAGTVQTALAALEQNRIDVLRPTPQQARLAYLMLATPLS